MDSYQSQFAYAPSADAYMSSLRYPSMGMTPMMGPMHMPPMESFPHSTGPAPMPAGAAAPAAPMGMAVSQLACSARIGNKASPCSIYRHDEMVGATSEHRAQQLCSADGRL
ncbi:hypothetical protein GGF43_005492, partial [Coemansia sp. RSA 2618]